jgi:hypothetical protein
MRKAFLTIPFAALVVAVTAQAAAASPHRRHPRTREFAVMSEKLRNSNAYAAPTYISVQPDPSAGTYGMTADNHFHYYKGSCWDLGTCD